MKTKIILAGAILLMAVVVTAAVLQHYGKISTTIHIGATSLPTWCAFHAIHTNYSDDGIMTLEESAISLREFYDCGATNDHDRHMSQEEWTNTLQIADDYNSDNQFTYFFGTEWTSSHGHKFYIAINPSPTQQDALDSSFDEVSELSSWLSNNMGVAQINHPARTSDLATDFSNPSEYDEEWTPLVEIINKGQWHWNYYWNCSENSGCQSYTNPHLPVDWRGKGQPPNGTGWIKYALDHGIHLGFSCGGDDHSDLPYEPYCYVGLANPSAWTREGIYQSLKSRNTWVSEEKTIMSVSVGDFIMGDMFISPQTGSLHYKISAADGKLINTVNFFFDGIIINVTSSGSPIAEGDFGYYLPDGNEHYMFVEAIQDDGKRAWSSPMWATEG